MYCHPRGIFLFCSEKDASLKIIPSVTNTGEKDVPLPNSHLSADFGETQLKAR